MNSLPGENVWSRYLQKQVVLPGVEDLENGVVTSRVVVPFDVVLGFLVVVGTVVTAPEVVVGFSVVLVVFMVFSVTVV